MIGVLQPVLLQTRPNPAAAAAAPANGKAKKKRRVALLPVSS